MMAATNLLDQQAPQHTPSSDQRQPQTQEPLSSTGTVQPNMRSKEHSDADNEQQTGLLKGTDIPKWKPNFTETMIMVTLALLSLMVSLDATVIVTSLSVCTTPAPSQESESNLIRPSDNCSILERDSDPGVLDWDVLPPCRRRDHALHRLDQ
jgi:hypothetical protein